MKATLSQETRSNKARQELEQFQSSKMFPQHSLGTGGHAEMIERLKILRTKYPIKNPPI